MPYVKSSMHATGGIISFSTGGFPILVSNEHTAFFAVLSMVKTPNHLTISNGNFPDFPYEKHTASMHQCALRGVQGTYACLIQHICLICDQAWIPQNSQAGCSGTFRFDLVGCFAVESLNPRETRDVLARWDPSRPSKEHATQPAEKPNLENADKNTTSSTFKTTHLPHF